MMETVKLDVAMVSPAKAEEIAAKMNILDPDWTYTAAHDPKGTGYSKVAIHDEDGAFVAFLSLGLP